MSQSALLSTGSVNLSELEKDRRFRWAIKDHAVVVIWQDKIDDPSSTLRHLGNRTPHNHEHSSLRIWIGEESQNKQLLIVLVMQIRLRASRKGSTRRIFLVVPSESLRLASTTPTFGEISQYNVPSPLLDHPNDKCSADSARILHIACLLDHDQSIMAIMPKAEYPRQVVGQPLCLLQSLKSLANAHKFDVYLNYNTYADRHLDEIRTMLDKSNLTTPSIDLASMYSCRGASVDDWSAQGWSANDEPASVCKRRKVTHSDHGTAEDAERCPPPYSEIGQQVVIPRSCTPEPIVCPNESISDVPETPVSWNQDTGSERLGTRPLVGHVLVVDNLVHANRQCSDIRNLETSSPPVEVVLADVTPAPTESSATRHPKSQLAIKPALTPRPRMHPSDISLSTAGPLWSKIYIDLCRWLTKAWTAFPEAHFIFSGSLLAMGAAAHDNDEALYARRRAECTTDLLYYRAQISGPVDVDDGMNFLRNHGHKPDAASRRERVVKQETTRIISWMNSIRPHADLPLIDDCLTTLAEKGIQLITFDQTTSSGESDYVSLLDDFNRSRAFCVAETCLTFGGESLASLDNIVARLQEECLQRYPRPIDPQYPV